VAGVGLRLGLGRGASGIGDLWPCALVKINGPIKRPDRYRVVLEPAQQAQMSVGPGTLSGPG
jgi:hypothetical protein